MEDSFVDPVVAEFRAAKEAYAKEFNYDVKAMMEDVRARQAASGRTYVNRVQKQMPTPKQGPDRNQSPGSKNGQCPSTDPA